ncbi:MAG: HAD-IIB family hydrolase [Erysipelotrichaceae bacterium]|nr:HAD-IIB family hydrolase [Erysipelotrichaceae bacterium]
MIETMKLLVADIDGTLVNEPREMMPLTRAVLNDLHTRGVLLGIASGRPLGPHLYEQKDEWKVNFNFDMWIGMNGGQLYDVHKDTYEHFYKLQPKTIEEIITFMKPMHANPFIYLGEDMLSEEVDEEMFESMKRHHIQCTKVEELSELWKGPTSKILFRLSDASQMPEAESFAAQHPSKDYAAFKTQPTMLEFQDPRVNKGLGVERYCQQNGISLDEVMAFGDMSNDNGMMSTAGWSVCLKNGSDDTKALANAITEYDNDHDGLGHYMIDHWYVTHGWKTPEPLDI